MIKQVEVNHERPLLVAKLGIRDGKLVCVVDNVQELPKANQDEALACLAAMLRQAAIDARVFDGISRDGAERMQATYEEHFRQYAGNTIEIPDYEETR